MADLNYTKGKWEIEGCNIQTANGRTIALAYDPDRPNHETLIALANARLIAAAVNACQKVNPDIPLAVAEALPDMYEALKEAINWLAFNRRDRPGTTGSLLADTINQALAKAEGKEEK